MEILKFVGLFGLGVGLDFIWAAYTLAVSAKRPISAAFWSVGIYLVGGVSAISYIGDHRALVPLAAGSFVGTYIAVKKA